MVISDSAMDISSVCTAPAWLLVFKSAFWIKHAICCGFGMLPYSRRTVVSYKRGNFRDRMKSSVRIFSQRFRNSRAAYWFVNAAVRYDRVRVATNLATLRSRFRRCFQLHSNPTQRSRFLETQQSYLLPHGEWLYCVSLG
jgi:hypothetical protein